MSSNDDSGTDGSATVSGESSSGSMPGETVTSATNPDLTADDSTKNADDSANDSGEPPDDSGESSDGCDDTPGDVGTDVVADPSDAFQALGNQIRMGILETMLDRARDETTTSRATFSELFESTDLDASSQFAYHLDQLVGPYLRKVESDATDADAGRSADGRSDAGYELTYAGLKIARAIATGAYTRRVDHPAIPIRESCPFCEADALEARSTDNVVTVACRACERALLSLRFPPSGLEAHGDRLPDAFDRYHRHRLALVRDGVCPECSGRVDADLVPPSEAVTDALPAELTDHLQASFACRQCGRDLRCPVTLSLLEHPAVVSFYRDHDRTVRDSPIWNVGHEWAESVLSTDPLAVRVVVELDGDVLALYVDASLTVVDVQRAVDDGEGHATESAPSPNS